MHIVGSTTGHARTPHGTSRPPNWTKSKNLRAEVPLGAVVRHLCYVGGSLRLAPAARKIWQSSATQNFRWRLCIDDCHSQVLSGTLIQVSGGVEYRADSDLRALLCSYFCLSRRCAMPRANGDCPATIGPQPVRQGSFLHLLLAIILGPGAPLGPDFVEGRVGGHPSFSTGQPELSRLVSGRLWPYYASGALALYVFVSFGPT